MIETKRTFEQIQNLCGLLGGSCIWYVENDVWGIAFPPNSNKQPLYIQKKDIQELIDKLTATIELRMDLM